MVHNRIHCYSDSRQLSQSAAQQQQHAVSNVISVTSTESPVIDMHVQIWGKELGETSRGCSLNTTNHNAEKELLFFYPGHIYRNM